LYETTDYAIMAAFGGNLLEWGQFLYGIENFLCELAAHPQKVEKLLDRLVEIHLEGLDKVLPAIDGYVQIIQMGDDLGSQTAAQISPEMYRRFFKPRHAEIYRRIKEQSSLAVFLHSCGSIEELLPDLIDVGVDIINPVQTSAARMDPAHLKREYGKDLVFWGGGCDTQVVLPTGTPDEIDAHVRDRIRTFGPGGGFVFATVHNIMANVPPENVVALYDAVKRYRDYPLDHDGPGSR
jgi:uroporphyrinogen decarboxylase